MLFATKRSESISIIEGDITELQPVYEYLTYFVDEKPRYLFSKVQGGTGSIYVRPGILNRLQDLFGMRVEMPGTDELVIEDFKDLARPLRKYQLRAVEEVFRWKSGLLRLATNSGKTHIATAILKGLQSKKCLFILHRSELLEQTAEYFRTMGGLDVGFVASGKGYDYDKNICIGMVGTLYSRLKRDKEFLAYLKSVDVVIVDEAHHAIAPSYVKILDKLVNAKVRIAMSGTLFERDTPQEKLLVSVFGELIYEVTNQDLDRWGVSAPVKVYMVSGDYFIPGLKESAKQYYIKMKYGHRTKFAAERLYFGKVYNEGLVDNNGRNLVVCQVVHRLIHKGQSGILVLVERIAHGLFLKDRLAAHGAEFISGESEHRHDALSQFKAGTLRVLIATSILDEGISVDLIHHLVLASGGKSKKKLLQRVGRGLRKSDDSKSLSVYDFMDASQEIPLLEKQSRNRKKVYEEEGWNVEPANIENFLL